MAAYCWWVCQQASFIRSNCARLHILTYVGQLQIRNLVRSSTYSKYVFRKLQLQLATHRWIRTANLSHIWLCSSADSQPRRFSIWPSHALVWNERASRWWAIDSSANKHVTQNYIFRTAVKKCSGSLKCWMIKLFFLIPGLSSTSLNWTLGLWVKSNIRNGPVWVTCLFALESSTCSLVSHKCMTWSNRKIAEAENLRLNRVRYVIN